jgi:predicted nucleotidyltransferase
MSMLVQPPELKFALPLDQLAVFCRQWRIAAIEVFGSALRNDFDDDSDLDLLVTYERDVRWSLIDHIAIERHLSELLGRKVDLVSRRAVEQSRNWIRRRGILASARPIYVA